MWYFLTEYFLPFLLIVVCVTLIRHYVIEPFYDFLFGAIGKLWNKRRKADEVRLKKQQEEREAETRRLAAEKAAEAERLKKEAEGEARIREKKKAEARRIAAEEAAEDEAKSEKVKPKQSKEKQPTVKAIPGEDVGGKPLVIPSKENPNQTDDLRIKFNPNHFFEQGEEYTYPVVKMPQEGSFLKLPRTGRACTKGYTEDDFYSVISEGISGVEVLNDVHLTIPFYNRPYEPDIVLVDKELNLYVDIEIDEPYDGHYRYPTHEFSRDDNGAIQKKDDIRDLFFTESGWVVIRFTERQVHLQSKECVTYIKDVIDSIRTNCFAESSGCASEKQWDYQQAIRWEKEYYRETYLGIAKFGKNLSSSEIIVDADEEERIEGNLSRTQQIHESNLQGNIGFEGESHIYHHPKNTTGNADYLSVTTLIDRFFPFDLDRFVKGKAQKEGLSEKDVLEEFKKNRDEAAIKGTYLHEQIEHFLNGNEYDGSSKEFGLFRNFYQEVVLSKGFEFVEAEKKVLLERYNIAGTVDALFKKPGKHEYLIVDWKRSKKLTVDGHPKKYGYGYASSELNHLDNSSYYKYALQQSIYRYILESHYEMPISTMNLIVLHEHFDEYHRINLPNLDKEVSIILESISHKI